MDLLDHSCKIHRKRSKSTSKSSSISVRDEHMSERCESKEDFCANVKENSTRTTSPPLPNEKQEGEEFLQSSMQKEHLLDNEVAVGIKGKRVTTDYYCGWVEN